jgi:effector-binding domain-containing protein
VRHEVTELVVPARPTAVVVATTTWAEFPTRWRPMLDEVYRFLAAHPQVHQTGHNVMYYRDDRPTVEVGVEVDAPFPGAGDVVASELPAGRVARTVHRGAYTGLGRAHDAVAAWCSTTGHQRVGPPSGSS